MATYRRQSKHRQLPGAMVLDARTRQSHLITAAAMAAGREPTGCYVASCGAEILPVDVDGAEPPQGICSDCVQIPTPAGAADDDAGDYPLRPLWGRSAEDECVHAVDPAAAHPPAIFVARCGHRLLRQRTTLYDYIPEGRRCPRCIRWSTPRRAAITQRRPVAEGGRR